MDRTTETLARYVTSFRYGDLSPSAVKEAKLHLFPEYVQETTFDKQGGHAKTLILLRLIPRPTAIFAGNDMIALGALLAVREAGLRCPEEISIMGFDDLRRFSHARGSMPVYASPETMRDLERVFQFAFNTSNPVPYYLRPEPHVIDGPFKLGETLIAPLPVPHGDSIVNGYLFLRADQKLVAYVSDCSAVPDAIVDLISGVRVLIIDALRDKPHPTHLSVGQALEVAALIKPEATYFTHICHDLPQSAESRLPAGVHIAYDGLKLSL